MTIIYCGDIKLLNLLHCRNKLNQLHMLFTAQPLMAVPVLFLPMVSRWVVCGKKLVWTVSETVWCKKLIIGKFGGVCVLHYDAALT